MQIRAGVASEDITPPIGTPLAGRPETHPTVAVHDPLKLKSLIIESGTSSIVLVSLDLLLLEFPEALRIRKDIADCLDLPLDAIILSTTHTHTGPGVGDWCEWEGRVNYEDDLSEKAVSAAKKAQTQMATASIHYSRDKGGGDVHNRRYVMRNGSVETVPRKEGALYADGPIDPELQAVQIEGPTETLAVLVGLACHPTSMGWRDNAISADFPFWIEQEVKAHFGANTEMLFFPGALGDVGPGGDPFDRSSQLGVDLARRVGMHTGRTTCRALTSGSVEVKGPVELRNEPVSVPTIDMGEARQSWARLVLNEPNSHPSTSVRDAHMVLEMCDTWSETIETEVPLIKIGSLAFYGIPGELFCWYGLQLKSRSPYEHPFILGLANDRIGYIADRVFPTKDIFNSPLQFVSRAFGSTGDAGERMVEAALRL